MSAPARQVALMLTPEELEAAIRRAIEPLRVEIERMKGGRNDELVTTEEAARRIGVDIRTVQRWLKDGRLQEEWIGGARMVRLPAGLAGR